MASVSKVSICSNALLNLGDNTINDLNDPSDRAKLVNLYDARRNALLRSHPWNCAVKRVVLSPDVSAPEFEYTNKFLLPSDCLRVLQVGEKYEYIDYRIEGEALLADADIIYLKYIFLNDNEATWDAMLIEAMELTMTAAFAYPITLSTSKEQACIENLENFLRRARAIDGIEDPPETLGNYRLLASRYGGNRHA